MSRLMCLQGHLAPVTRSEDVADVLSRLLQNSKVQMYADPLAALLPKGDVLTDKH